jgi:glucose-1-phosphate adenylyltransferase
VHRSLLFSNVHVHSYATVEDSVILPKVDIGQGAKLRKTVIDKNCKIPPGMIIGYDPEEDRKRFHVSAGGVTLVTPEMLDQHIHQLR